MMDEHRLHNHGIENLPLLSESAAVAVAHEVGASAADQGAPLHEVLDLVERAYGGTPEHRVVRAASLAWSERVTEHAHGITCEDELTGLATTGHLRSRLAEIHREADMAGVRVADTHVLVGVQLVAGLGASSLERALHALEVSEVLREVFPGEETIARINERCFVVLVRRDRADAMTLALVRLLVQRTSAGVPSPRLWVEELPGDYEDSVRVVAELST